MSLRILARPLLMLVHATAMGALSGLVTKEANPQRALIRLARAFEGPLSEGQHALPLLAFGLGLLFWPPLAFVLRRLSSMRTGQVPPVAASVFAGISYVSAVSVTTAVGYIPFQLAVRGQLDETLRTNLLGLVGGEILAICIAGGQLLLATPILIAVGAPLGLLTAYGVRKPVAPDQ